MISLKKKVNLTKKTLPCYKVELRKNVIVNLRKDNSHNT